MRKDWAADFESRNYGLRRRTDRQNLLDLLGRITMFLLIAGVLVVRSWEQGQIVSVGYRTQQLQAIEESQLRLERALVLEEAMLKDPARVDEFARNAGLEPVRPNQIIPARYPEPEAAGTLSLSAAPPAPPTRRTEIAQRASTTIEDRKLGATN